MSRQQKILYRLSTWSQPESCNNQHTPHQRASVKTWTHVISTAFAINARQLIVDCISKTFFSLRGICGLVDPVVSALDVRP